MKYYESRFSKFVGSAGFYVIIAVCLLAIGGASWFAISRYNEPAASESENSSQGMPSRNETSSIREAPAAESSSTPSMPSENPSVGVEKTVSDEPYESQPPTAEYFDSPVSGSVSKGYSETELQYSATYGDMRIHNGIDIACEKGNEVKASGDGTVESVEESATLGTVVTIDHGNGIGVKYCGLGDVTVTAGQELTLGTVIGTVSEVPCECADQSHIHIEVYKDGSAVSPLTALGIQ